MTPYSISPMKNTRPTIGLLLTYPPTSSYMRPIWLGAMQAAQALDVNLLCFGGSEADEPENLHRHETLFEQINPRTVDGLVLINMCKPEVLQRLKRPLPMVILNTPSPGIPSILADNYRGMFAAVTHLIEKHHCQRIAFVKGKAGHPDADERFQAYVDALSRHQQKVDPDLLFQGDFIAPSGREAVFTFVDKRRVNFDAIACANDEMALGALDALQAREIRVPYDVAVVGFDDIEQAAFTNPPLTTVVQPLRAMAQRAVELVLAQIRGEHVASMETFPSELVVRQSCGGFSNVVLEASAHHRRKWFSDFSLSRLRISHRRALAARRSKILDAMQAALSYPAGDEGNAYEPWLEGLSSDLEGSTSRAFLAAIDHTARQTIEFGKPVSSLQDPVSALRTQCLSALDGFPNARARAEDLWHQARIFLGETMLRQQSQRAAQEEAQVDMLHAIGDELITTFEVEALAEIIVRSLPRLNIRSGYLVLFEGKEWPSSSSRLVAHFNENGLTPLEPEGVSFLTSDLLPSHIHKAARRFDHLIMPLFFKEEQLGYVVFEIGPHNGNIYELLRGQLSSALKGALLFRERDQLLAHVSENSRLVSAASGQLAEIADKASQVTAQITLTIHQMALGAEQQVDASSQISASVDQMMALIQQVAANAQEGAGRATEATQVAQAGSSIVDANIQSMLRLKTQVGSSARKVEEMGARSQQIGLIVETISDIASQTNLLALNAAIEAAHTGEHGRSFAVVADEVRKLAERATQATREIDALIKSILNTVTQAVNAMKKNVTEVESVVELTNQSGQSLQSILTASAFANQSAEKINYLAQNLSASSEEINRFIENIVSVSEESSAAIEEVSASADEMNNQVREVNISAQSLDEMACSLQGIGEQFSPERQLQP